MEQRTFKRKIYNDMLKWKESLSNKKKALVIKGPRQVGKTTIVKEFASNNYDNVVYINFMKNKALREIFDHDFDIDNIILDLSIKLDVQFIPNKTVIIFDEIQECANARSSLKFICEDGRYDVICTGSLLGISGYSKKIDASIPVGFEYFLDMKPMDFEEFLWAIGKPKASIDKLKEYFYSSKQIPKIVHDEMELSFKKYICVGGMPEAVLAFVKKNDFTEVRNAQISILESYKSDFGKHLDTNENEYVNNSELNQIKLVFSSIPFQLAKENKRFRFKEVKTGRTYRDFESSIKWLEGAGIISLCYNVNNVQFPLEGFRIDNSFKIYMNDTGLFLSMLNNSVTKSIYFDDIGMYKGYIYENIIADAFVKNNIPLTYYSNKYEVDFLTQFRSKIVPIEVKAKDGNSKSLKALINSYKDDILFSIKIKNSNIGFVDNVLTIPHYLVFMINEQDIDKWYEQNISNSK